MTTRFDLVLGSLALVAGVACSERPPQPPASPQRPLEIATASAVPEIGPPPNDAPTVASSFPASSITGFANQVTELVGHVLDGRPPPRGPLPLVPWQSSDQLVKPWRQVATPRRAELEIIIFAMELDVVLSEGTVAPIAAPGEQDTGKLETILFLSRTGLKLAKLNVRAPSRPQPVPPWLEGASRFGAQIFDAAAAGALESLLVGEPERAVIGDDVLYEQLIRDLPKRLELERAQALARSRREPLGLRFDDVFVIARDRQGEIWGFKLEIEEEEGQLAFATSPLIEVNRLEPPVRSGPPNE